jgi:hypothetical protein
VANELANFVLAWDCLERRGFWRGCIWTATTATRFVVVGIITTFCAPHADVCPWLMRAASRPRSNRSRGSLTSESIPTCSSSAASAANARPLAPEFGLIHFSQADAPKGVIAGLLVDGRYRWPARELWCCTHSCSFACWWSSS